KDRNRLWVETEGETDLSSDSGDIENFDVQYSYRFDRFWDIQTGLGAQTTFGPSPNK
ncbi:MAG TPA: copper resistance protein B, partial [Marinobacter adhaerens]|nr:copper resistance protein B [Marinobacter adhaerens]